MSRHLHLLQVVTLYGFRGDGLVTERRVSMKHGEPIVFGVSQRIEYAQGPGRFDCTEDTYLLRCELLYAL